MKFITIFITALTAIATFSNASAQSDRECFLKDPGAHTRDHNFDVQHIGMDLSFVPDSGKVYGTVEHTFVPTQQDVDTLFMDAPDIDIQKVLLDGKPTPFKTNKDGLIVNFAKTLHWDEKHVLSITYEAHPKKGIYFIGWNDTTNMSHKQIWTQGQGIDNRYWLPSFDDEIDKATTDMVVHFDKDYRVLSNGDLVEEKLDKDKKTKTWHYKLDKPYSSYLIMLGIGKYDVHTVKSKGGVVINEWYYPEHPETLEPTYRYTEDMMDFLEKETGVKYPWPSYSIIPVQDFMYGAMENVTATVYGDFYLVDKRAFLDRYYIGTNSHEMTHQWFGDYITARNEAHHWLQESFATHYQKWFERSIFGDDHFQWNRRNELWSVMNAAKTDNNPIAFTNAGSARVYPKGSLVLDMMVYVLGKDQYDRGIKYYLDHHGYSNVDTHDFYLAFEESLGINLDWFFDEWLYHGGEPHYTVSYLDVPKNNDKSRFTQITVEQTQTQDGLVGLFKMPMVFEVHYKDGTTSQLKTMVEKQTEIVNVPNPNNKEIDFVLFDPNSEIIKFVDFKKSTDELIAQAAKAPNMIDRYDALAALAATPLDQKKDFLVERYNKETFYANREEIVKQLLQKNDKPDLTLVKQFLKDPNARVRQAVVNNIDNIPATAMTDFEALLKDSSYWVEEAALIKMCQTFPQNTNRYLDITKNDNGIGKRLHVAWLEIAARQDSAKYMADLVQHVSRSYEFLTRTYACAALSRLNYLDQKAIDYMVDAALNGNRRLANPAIQTLNTFKGQTKYRQILKDYYDTHKWEPWQDAIIKPVLN